ncbi:hypothetical protein SeLEV6574_g02794 [Synchytrium endobioticum]|uniref:Shikimate O-hydroxycinnamoyltransferase n=1 Tax=Synchytrium endobioticum TaxID=286115 RepID=A0A507D6F6_9FUNG|nr:hypothetical protein SeLEV6574_g02794 [Synchytrium endobioticum]
MIQCTESEKPVNQMEAKLRSAHIIRAEALSEPKATYDLNLLDSTIARLYIRPAYFFEAPRTALSDEFWINSLSKTLNDYRFLTGTVTRHSSTRLSLTESDRGCTLEFAETPQLTLSLLRHAQFGSESVPDSLYPSAGIVQDDTTWNSIELLRVRITTLGDGAIVLGASMFHSVWDGHSMFQFIKDWAATARGEGFIPPVRDPVLLRPLSQPQTASTPSATTHAARPAAATPKLSQAPVLENFYVSPSALQELKAYVSSLPLPDGPMRDAASQVSSQDCLAALIWWSLVQTSNARSSKINTVCAYPVNLRTLKRPLVPMEYCGNAWLSMHEKTAKFSINDLIASENGIRMAACAIRHGVMSLTAGHLEEQLARLSSNPPIPDLSILGCFITSWRGFRVYDTDFGFGKPLEFIPLHSKNPHVMVTYIRPMPDDAGNGYKGESGAEFQLCLGQDEMSRLKHNIVFGRHVHWFENGSRSRSVS